MDGQRSQWTAIGQSERVHERSWVKLDGPRGFKLDDFHRKDSTYIVRESKWSKRRKLDVHMKDNKIFRNFKNGRSFGGGWYGPYDMVVDCFQVYFPMKTQRVL